MAYELLIKNGTVVDGTGAARYQADIGGSAGPDRRDRPNRNARVGVPAALLTRPT